MTTYHKDGLLPDPDMIFVFGSNLAGVHGAGAARAALDHFDAELGVGEGRTGRAYAIPTKVNSVKARELYQIEASVETFLAHAAACYRDRFFVTRIGCGLAGFKDEEIAPMFEGAPDNCSFPAEWRPWLD